MMYVQGEGVASSRSHVNHTTTYTNETAYTTLHTAMTIT